MHSNTNNNGQPSEGGIPAQAAFSPIAVPITAPLSDLLQTPANVDKLRRAVRSWFLSSVLHFDDTLQPSGLADNCFYYEAVDEFLSSLLTAPQA